MNKIHNPPTVFAAPAYSHGIEAPPNARLLYVAGQVGVGLDGKVRDGTAAQADQVWANILNVLAAAGMGPENLHKITTFIVNEADVPVVRAAREKALGACKPASTLLIVKALANPEFKVEIEAVAAKP